MQRKSQAKRASETDAAGFSQGAPRSGAPRLRLFQSRSIQIIVRIIHAVRSKRRKQDRAIQERHKHVLLRAAVDHPKGEQSPTWVLQFVHGAIVEIGGIRDRSERGGGELPALSMPDSRAPR